MGIGHEIISMVIFFSSVDSRRVLVNHLVRLSQEKSVVRLADRPNMTIAVDWDVKNQTKQTNKCSLM